MHTWSLAIEEQFYIVFPLVLLLAIRLVGRRWIGLAFAFFVLSFAASIWVTEVNPGAAFYLAPMRVWELMLGALLASGILPRTSSQGFREVVALVGLTLIAFAVFCFSSTTTFPGASALVPCLGTAFLIYAGEDQGTSIVAKVLSFSPLVFVGLISYSLYLWHWPLLVFCRYWNIHELSAAQAGLVVIASFALAVLSWAYVEQPFRRKQAPIPRGILFAGAATAIGVVLFAGTLDVRMRGFPQRFSPQVLAVFRDVKADGDGALMSSCPKTENGSCVLGASVTPSYAIWGDSHARTMALGLARLAERHGQAVEVFFRSSCPPIIQEGPAPDQSHDCLSKNSKTMRMLESSSAIRTVILISRYALYVEGGVDGEAFRRGPRFFLARILCEKGLLRTTSLGLQLTGSSAQAK